MIVDSSALVALIMSERRAGEVFDALEANRGSAIAAPALLETAMVLAGRRTGGTTQAEADLERVVARFELAVVPFADEHWTTAWAAFVHFGKGRHPAALNFGDCLTYAVAKLSGQPLLCVGNDFAQTDLTLVPLPE